MKVTMDGEDRAVWTPENRTERDSCASLGTKYLKAKARANAQRNAPDTKKAQEKREEAQRDMKKAQEALQGKLTVAYFTGNWETDETV
ncbi:MAG: hypothetical protein H3C30_19300 [Candidatus Hydrogenedentes bacterium]|nr:hypothetical protein [Candidatus Hydrogenedentota bacterium]